MTGHNSARFLSKDQLEELLEQPLEEPYKPLPPAPHYKRFYDYFCFCLDELATNDFMLDLKNPHFSCTIIYQPNQSPVNFLFTSAILDGTEQQLDNLRIIPNTGHKKSHDRLEAMFADLGDLSDALDLRICSRQVGPIFLLESDSPDDLLELLLRYKNICGFRTLDDEMGKPVLTKGRNVEHCSNRYRTKAQRDYNIKDDGIAHKRIDIGYLPPAAYINRDFAYVAHQKTWHKDTLGFSMSLLENILREEKGLHIKAGQGLVRYH